MPKENPLDRDTAREALMNLDAERKALAEKVALTETRAGELAEKVAQLTHDLQVSRKVLSLVADGAIGIKEAGEYVELLSKFAGDDLDRATALIVKKASSSSSGNPFAGIARTPASNDVVGRKIDSLLETLS